MNGKEEKPERAAEEREPMTWAMFTRCETNVAQYLLLGAARSEIAGILKITEHTVKSHVQSIFKKAAVKSQKEFMVKHFFPKVTVRDVIGIG